MPPAFSHFLETPLGWLVITGTSLGLQRITFLDEKPEAALKEIPDCLKPAISQLTEYFAGKRTEFQLTLAPNGTDFQQKVWQQLLQIPFGKIESYLTIARQLGEPTYTRAVGSANGRNPLAIVVPCHRVIGANGALTGYAGGLWRKKWLLNLEGYSSQTELFPS